MKLSLELIKVLEIPDQLSEGKFVGPWKSPYKHCGPENKMTPLKSSISTLSNSAVYTLVSGSFLWSAVRLRKEVDTTPLLMAAEALFAWQQDWRLFKRPRNFIGNIEFIEKQPRALASQLFLLDCIHQDYGFGNKKWTAGSMFSTAAEVITLTRYNLPKDSVPAFDKWTKGMLLRLKKIAKIGNLAHKSHPNLGYGDTPARRELAAKIMGLPLPPSVLDLSQPCDPKKFGAEWKTTLEALSWNKNPYLVKSKKTNKVRLSGPVK